MEDRKKLMISIIVPVYNVENFLERCIKSILGQTLPNFELILVDDGSPDNSGAICDEYAGKDSRVKVIHKPNGGVSSARNAGIDIARGEWICFIDSDDWINEDYLQGFNFYKEDADMYLQGYVELISDNKIVAKHQMKCPRNACIADIIAESERCYIMNSPCFKLFEAHIIYNNNIRFDERLAYGEDHVFSLEYLLHVDTIAFSDRMGYNVNRGREGSLTQSSVAFDKMYYYTTSSYELHQKLLETNFDPNNKLRVAVNQRYYKNINKLLYDGFNEGISKEKLQQVKRIIDLRPICTKGIGLKHVFFLFAVKLLPYRVLNIIFR